MAYGRGYEGSKYVQGRSTKEIARLIRQEIKKGISDGTYPKGLKVSVRYKSFSGGSSIDCDIVALPKGFRVYSRETSGSMGEAGARPEDLLNSPGQYCSKYSSELAELRGKLKAMVQAYRRDDSDAMVDYFDVNFYGGYFELSWEIEKSLRDNKSDVIV
jgi:hypothetical protein